MNRFVLCSTGVFLLFATALMGETRRALRGTVQDPGGGSVPGAAVRLSHEDTRSAYRTKTGHDGSFSIEGLLPGPYVLEVTAGGFRYYRANVRVATEQQSVTVWLSLAPVSSTITVHGDEPADVRAEVEADYTANKSVTSAEGERSLDYNPVANYDLLRVMPGVMSPAYGGKDRFSVPSSFRGSASWGTVETVDEYPAISITAVSAEDGGYTAGFSSIIPGLALRKLSLATGGLGVTYGQASGGVVRSTLKHGSAGQPFTSVRLEGSGIGEGIAMAETGGGIGKFDYYVAGQSVTGEYGDAYATYARPIQDLRLYSGLVKAGYRMSPGGRLEGLFIGGDERHSFFQDSLLAAENRTVRRDYHTDKENYFAAVRYDYRPSDDIVFGAGMTHNRFHENRIEDTADGVPTEVSRRNRPQWATRGFTNLSLRRELRPGLVYSGSGGGDVTWDRFRDITTTPVGFSFREQGIYWRNTATVGGRLSLIGGVRASLIDNGFRDLTRSSYDIGAAYVLPTHTRLKISRSTGYKLNKPFYLWWGNGRYIDRAPRRGLEPSGTGTWEAGVEQNVHAGTRLCGVVRATWFDTRETRLPNFGDTRTGAAWYDDARARGVEWWTEWRLGRVRPFASFTRLWNARTGSTNPLSTNVDLRFTPLPNSAAGFGAQVDATPRLLLGFMGFRDSGAIQEQVVNDSIVVSRFRSFSKVNATASYALNARLSLLGRIENLLNRRDLGYSRTVLNPDGSSRHISGTQRDPGIIFGGGLQYRF
ncbi:MAG TPA: carboxypeptidase regulatory-like domain-containing protein [Bryobacteraceae bacterium]|nr:carboxypeptidase regulatory-like domain-containing protein [Bryobacteraceae bacterium]